MTYINFILPDVENLLKKVYPFVEHDERVTENVFEYIEHKSKEALKMYKDICSSRGSYQVNPEIGYAVKHLYDWDDCGTASARKSKTTLISSFTKHKRVKLTIACDPDSDKKCIACKIAHKKQK